MHSIRNVPLVCSPGKRNSSTEAYKKKKKKNRSDVTVFSVPDKVACLVKLIYTNKTNSCLITPPRRGAGI